MCGKELELDFEHVPTKHTHECQGFLAVCRSFLHLDMYILLAYETKHRHTRNLAKAKPKVWRKKLTTILCTILFLYLHLDHTHMCHDSAETMSLPIFSFVSIQLENSEHVNTQ